MALDAAAPSSHKRKIQRSADSGAGQGNQAASPLFRRFGAKLGGETFSDTRRKFLEKLFFSQILAVIDAGGSRSRLPHLDPLVRALTFNSLNQKTTLNNPPAD